MSNYTDSFVLFKNDKQGNANWPDYKGKLNVGGKELEIAAWIKDGQNGKFMSGKVSESRQKQEPPNQPPPAQVDEFDDQDLPF